MEHTDKSLIDAHCRGDREAFGELVRRYGDSILGYLIRMTGNRQQAEDLFQETFKRIHEKAHTYRGGAFKSWLFRIARNAAIDGLRKQKRLQVVSLNQNLGCANGDCEELGAVTVAQNYRDPSQEVIMAEQKEQVRLAIESLPEKQRSALVLAYYQQLSYTEVAQALGCSAGTVKTQMSRALRTLAQKLPELGGVVK